MQQRPRRTDCPHIRGTESGQTAQVGGTWRARHGPCRAIAMEHGAANARCPDVAFGRKPLNSSNSPPCTSVHTAGNPLRGHATRFAAQLCRPASCDALTPTAASSSAFNAESPPPESGIIATEASSGSFCALSVLPRSWLAVHAATAIKTSESEQPKPSRRREKVGVMFPHCTRPPQSVTSAPQIIHS